MAYTPKLAPLDPCPVEHVVHLVGGKWKARLLGLLRDRPRSAGDLQRCLPRATPQVLLEQLKGMQRVGLVRRLPASSGTIWGHYAVTERATTLLAAVDVIAAWGAIDLATGGSPIAAPN